MESKSSRWSAHSPFILLRKHTTTVVVAVVIVKITVDPTEERKGKQVSAIFEK